MANPLFANSIPLYSKLLDTRMKINELQFQLPKLEEAFTDQVCKDAQQLAWKWVLINTPHGPCIYHCTGVSRRYETNPYTGKPELSREHLDLACDAQGWKQPRSGEWVCDDIDPTTYSFWKNLLFNCKILTTEEVRRDYNYDGCIE